MEQMIPRILQEQGQTNQQIYLVGGAIRDQLLGREMKDLDFVVSEGPEGLADGVSKALGGKVILLDEIHRIYRVILSDGSILDFSQMKGSTIGEDLSHRDFTINALAYNLALGWPLRTDVIIDPYGGVRDLEDRVLRAVHPNTFQEDPVRMLRAVRFMAELDFTLHPDTVKLIQRDCQGIQGAPGERITQELFPLLEQRNSHQHLQYLDQPLQLLDQIFPHIREMKQVGECKYHVVDSWTHSLHTLRLMEEIINAQGFFEASIGSSYEAHTKEIIAGNRSRLSLIKLGALFHDVGKPAARIVDETGRVRFPGHEMTGAEIVEGYAQRLKLSNREREILHRYVAFHMFPLSMYKYDTLTDENLYEIFRQTEGETLDILLIALADIVATRMLLDPKEDMSKYKRFVEEIIHRYLGKYEKWRSLQQLVKGDVIMKHLNLPPGPVVGEIIEKIRKGLFLGEIAPDQEAIAKAIVDGFHHLVNNPSHV